MFDMNASRTKSAEVCFAPRLFCASYSQGFPQPILSFKYFSTEHGFSESTVHQIL
jgi:hypothetical protein